MPKRVNKKAKTAPAPSSSSSAIAPVPSSASSAVPPSHSAHAGQPSIPPRMDSNTLFQRMVDAFRASEAARESPVPSVSSSSSPLALPLLPAVCWSEILAYCDVKDVVSVCKTWREICLFPGRDIRRTPRFFLIRVTSHFLWLQADAYLKKLRAFGHQIGGLLVNSDTLLSCSLVVCYSAHPVSAVYHGPFDTQSIEEWIKLCDKAPIVMIDLPDYDRVVEHFTPSLSVAVANRARVFDSANVDLFVRLQSRLTVYGGFLPPLVTMKYPDAGILSFQTLRQCMAATVCFSSMPTVFVTYMERDCATETQLFDEERLRTVNRLYVIGASSAEMLLLSALLCRYVRHYWKGSLVKRLLRFEEAITLNHGGRLGVAPAYAKVYRPQRDSLGALVPPVEGTEYAEASLERLRDDKFYRVLGVPPDASHYVSGGSDMVKFSGGKVVATARVMLRCSIYMRGEELKLYCDFRLGWPPAEIAVL